MTHWRFFRTPRAALSPTWPRPLSSVTQMILRQGFPGERHSPPPTHLSSSTPCCLSLMAEIPLPSSFPQREILKNLAVFLHISRPDQPPGFSFFFFSLHFSQRGFPPLPPPQNPPSSDSFFRAGTLLSARAGSPCVRRRLVPSH